MKIKGKVVTYEMFVARNNQMKAMLKQSNAPDRLVRVSMLETATHGNYETVRVWLDNDKVMKAIELVYAIMNGHGAVSNPSIFDGWGGWHCEEEINESPKMQARATKLSGHKQAYSVARFSSWSQDVDGSCKLVASVKIPTFLRKSIRCVTLEHLPENMKAMQVTNEVTNITKIGSEKDTSSMRLTFEYFCKEGNGQSLQVDFDITQNTDQFSCVFAYEELPASDAKGLLPKASDGKYYNVWWKKNARETLCYGAWERGDFYEKASDVYMPIEYCVPNRLPDFVPANKVRQVEGGYEYIPEGKDAKPHFAGFYNGVWIQHGAGRYQYISAGTPSALSYSVVGLRGQRYGNINSFVELCTKSLGK